MPTWLTGWLMSWLITLPPFRAEPVAGTKRIPLEQRGSRCHCVDETLNNGLRLDANPTNKRQATESATNDRSEIKRTAGSISSARSGPARVSAGQVVRSTFIGLHVFFYSSSPRVNLSLRSPMIRAPLNGLSRIWRQMLAIASRRLCEERELSPFHCASISPAIFSAVCWLANIRNPRKWRCRH